MYNNPATRPLFRLLAPLGFGAVVYLLVLLAFDTHGRVLSDFFNNELLVCIGMSYLVLEGNRLIAATIGTYGQHLWIRISGQLILALLLTLLLCSGALILYFRYQAGLSNIISFYTELKVFNAIFLFIALLYQGYFLGFRWLHYQYQQKIATEERLHQQLDQQVYQFCYDIHPDFLYAGLEHIILKIREQQEQMADEGITLLAELYHYFLRPQEELVPLKDELEVVKKLHRLLAQSGKYLALETSIEDENRLLVPGSLVRLLEAIAQSQLSSAAAPLMVNLVQQTGVLEVHFKPNFSLTSADKLEQMLQLLQQQYSWLTGNALSWSSDTTYTISLPTPNLVPHESHHH